MLVPEVKDTHLSVYLRKGCSDDSVLEREVFWLWHILWDYLDDKERVEYININPTYSSKLNDIDPLLKFCSDKYKNLHVSN